MSITAPTRRERLRRQTLQEIREHALEQVAEGGPAAVSLNAIARAMGMSGAGIYRYYASREDLLDAVIAAGYAELTSTLERAEREHADRPPAEQLEAIAGAYRAWAIAHPHQYYMMFGPRPRPLSTGDSAEAIQTMHGGMLVVLRLIGDLVGDDGPHAPRPLDEDLRTWSARHDGEPSVPPAVLRLGVLTWTRLHGIICLELAGILADMGLQPELLVADELQSVRAEAAGEIKATH